MARLSSETKMISRSENVRQKMNHLDFDIIIICFSKMIDLQKWINLGALKKFVWRINSIDVVCLIFQIYSNLIDLVNVCVKIGWMMWILGNDLGQLYTSLHVTWFTESLGVHSLTSLTKHNNIHTTTSSYSQNSRSRRLLFWQPRIITN